MTMVAPHGIQRNISNIFNNLYVYVFVVKLIHFAYSVLVLLYLVLMWFKLKHAVLSRNLMDL